MSARTPQVSNIAAGASFLHVLARTILQRHAEAVRADPFALADITILLPTRRAVRALGEIFLTEWTARTARPKAALALPLIRPLGDIDEEALTIASDFSLAGEEMSLSLPPAISSMRRLFILARLISRFEQKTTGQKAEPAVIFSLAGELANFLDLAETEEADLDALASLVPERFAAHWQETVDFLTILTKSWPHILTEQNLINPALRRSRLIDAYAEQLAMHPPKAPIIAAGSTGSVPATARLLSVIARLPSGEVVLPGLDEELDEESWAALGPDHPQYGLRELLNSLAVTRKDVKPFAVDGRDKKHDDAAQARRLLLREALRPPETTGTWASVRQRLLPILPLACAGLQRIDAPTERAEAGAIALIMREVLETPGRTAALVTPQRALARRVAALLARFGVSVDDSAGVPLRLTKPGIFLRLIAELAASSLAPVSLLALLKHPLTALALEPAQARLGARFLELHLLRGPRPASDFAGLRQALRQHPGRRSHASQFLLLEDFLDRLEKALSPLLSALSTGADLFGIAKAHTGAAEALARSHVQNGSERLWAGDAGETAAHFMRGLVDEGPHFDVNDKLSGESYARLFDALMSGHVVRPRAPQHPRLAIWGLLEARLQSADVMILGGLNEGTWPDEPELGPWLSRPMRTRLGLSAPERRQGLMAHDFSQAASVPTVILTRAEKQDGAPTIPSRWLLRLQAVRRAAGEDDARDAVNEASDYLAWYQNLDEVTSVATPSPPKPMPPVAARPRRLSVTRIETLIRNPYAIYARHILNLRVLEPLDAALDARHRGIAIHEILKRFLRQFPTGMLPDDALARLLRVGEEVFAALPPALAVEAIWRPRFADMARWFIGFEQERRTKAKTLATEVDGQRIFATRTHPFILTAKADRIDQLADGSYEIMDYKTGQPPSDKQVQSGLSPQLPLEAIIAEAGGFASIAPGKVSALSFVHLSATNAKRRHRVIKDSALAIRKISGDFLKLVNDYDDPSTPYLCKPRAQFRHQADDYDHLARVWEWINNYSDLGMDESDDEEANEEAGKEE
jgi:ATP-dependent helicase/nuclease subunit B